MRNQADELFDKGIFWEMAAEFDKAKAVYEDIFHHVTDETVLEKVRCRMEDIDDLIAEKAVYQRIDENAKRVL
ncbi:MAG: trimethylamine--corrinoid methyltransferase, partial [Desulfobacteraceae bacterium]|nr:trimethylamine--corrinoid methyltransferase [Desulfobacteraceae bacterium]